MGIEPGWVKRNESATGDKLKSILSINLSSRLQIQSILQTTEPNASRENFIMDDRSKKKTPTSNFCNLHTTLISISIQTNYYLSHPLLWSRCVRFGEIGRSDFFKVVRIANRFYLPGKFSFSP
jgi:hypothetical protein